jgi:hypothetical protein
MNFSPHIRQLFQLRGRASTYTPPVGAAVPLKAIRQGGGQRIMLGYLKISPERTCFHVQRADVPAPVAGAVLEWDGEAFTIDAVQPVERDADGLMWEFDASWGLDVVLRSATGSGTSQSPPQGAGFTVAAAALAGAAAVSIKAGFTTGKLVAGDKFTIAGNATEYTVTGPGVAAVSNQFSNVPITPVLAADAAQGAAVTFDFALDFIVRAAIANYTQDEYKGTVQMGDRRIVLLQSALDQSDMTEAPKAGDRVAMENQTFSVVSAVATYQAGEPYAWDLQLRRG